MTILKYSIATVLLSVPALAQTNGTYLLTSSNTVSPSSPTTIIEMWATWDDPGEQFRFADGDYDLTAGDGIFSNPVTWLLGPGATSGIITGNVISGARIGQLLLSSIPLVPVVNPILLATYDWSTTDFTPRAVSLDTSNTSVFTVGIPFFSQSTIFVELFPGEFTPGSGVINIVPTPAAWFALALPLFAGRRRRC